MLLGEDMNDESEFGIHWGIMGTGNIGWSVITMQLNLCNCPETGELFPKGV